MDNAALVSPDIEKGREILETLDRAGLKVTVALWAVLAEYGDWRVVLSVREFDQLGLLDAYGRLHELLDAAGFDPRTTPSVMIFRTSDPFIKGLRRVFGKSRGVEGMRLGGQSFGDRFIEDAYVYRIS
jgi:hypothetical protein